MKRQDAMTDMNKEFDAILRYWLMMAREMQATILETRDGKKRLQILLHGGVMHLELHGRPDGIRPFQFDNYFNYFKEQLHAGYANTDRLELTAVDYLQLMQEVVLYFVRALAFSKIKDYVYCVRDSRRNLLVIDFIEQRTTPYHGSVGQFRPFFMLLCQHALKSAESNQDAHLCEEDLCDAMPTGDMVDGYQSIYKIDQYLRDRTISTFDLLKDGYFDLAAARDWEWADRELQQMMAN
jgi:hypothetical protein